MNFARIQIKKEFRHLVLYGIIGLCGATLDFLIYCFLTSQGVFYQYANLTSVSCGIILNFFLNAKFNFRTETKKINRFLCFYSVGMGGWFLSAALLYAGIELVHLSEIVTKLLSIVVVTSSQFILNRTVTFRLR